MFYVCGHTISVDTTGVWRDTPFVYLNLNTLMCFDTQGDHTHHHVADHTVAKHSKSATQHANVYAAKDSKVGVEYNGRTTCTIK